MFPSDSVAYVCVCVRAMEATNGPQSKHMMMSFSRDEVVTGLLRVGGERKCR